MYNDDNFKQINGYGLTSDYSNAILKGLIESPRDVIIFALDHEYRYIVFNESHRKTMKRIWGAEISLGADMLDFISNPEDRLRAKSNFDRALSGESFILEEEYGDIALERRYYEDIYSPIVDEKGDVTGLTLFLTDITERKNTENERDRLLVELKEALDKVKLLSGFLSVCSKCKNIRDEFGNWEPIELYIGRHSEANFSHGICPDCAKVLYPDLKKK